MKITNKLECTICHCAIDLSEVDTAEKWTEHRTVVRMANCERCGNNQFHLVQEFFKPEKKGKEQTHGIADNPDVGKGNDPAKGE